MALESVITLRLEPGVHAHLSAVARDTDFDDFWDSNAAPIGPQGKIIAGMSASGREELARRLRAHLARPANGRIVFEAFANAVKGRVPG